ncbi:MAG: enoyl-CoA hydratase/isomerase family protein [Chloroflexota bacterium]|nr:enoyl-CoA hydratase/isomerase family protein [Chloroflexota bacterium]
MVNLQSFNEEKIQLINLKSVDKNDDPCRQLMWSLEDAINELYAKDSVTVVLINIPDIELRCDRHAGNDGNKSLSLSISNIKFPTIGIVESEAHGTALELFLCCDIRVADKTSKFSMSHVLAGHTPVDGGTQRLPRIVGVGRAMDLLLTGRVFSAAEALEIGVVQYLHSEDVLENAVELAHKIASHGPIAAKYLKEAIVGGSDMTLDQGLRLETDLNVILQSTFDRKEGIDSFLEKKEPRYEGR